MNLPPGFVASTLSLAASRIVPLALRGAGSLHGALAPIDEDLRRGRSVRDVTAVLDRARPSLFALLAARFPATAAQALTVKILNLLLARYHFASRSASVLSKPFGLVVDPSNVCQLACPGCVHSSGSELLQLFDWPRATLTESRFAALLKLYGPSAIGIYFCDYGEPLLNLQTPRLVQMAKRYLMATALSTSLSVKKFDAEAYVESGLDLMVLSIDGATQPVYERFRRNGNLELVLRNVTRLVEAKRRLGRRTPVLSWNFLAFEHNVHEIPDAERLARRLGVNHFRVVNPFDVTWDDPEIRPAATPASLKRLDWTSISNAPENWNPFPESVEKGPIEEAFETAFSSLAVDCPPTEPGHTCHWLYKNMIMDATGRVMPCCGAPATDGKLVFGAIGDADPFNSPKYQQARGFFTGERDAAAGVQCSTCDWDQTLVNIGAPEIRRYFRAADPWLFDRRSLDLLSAW